MVSRPVAVCLLVAATGAGWVAAAYGAGPQTVAATTSRNDAAVSPPASNADGGGDARNLARAMVLLVASLLVLVLVGLAIWVLQWGRLLRRPAGLARPRDAGPDPWVVSGQRLKADSDETTDERRP